MSTSDRVVTKRFAVWLWALTVVVAGAVVLLVVWPGSQPSRTGHDWTAEWLAEPPVISTIPGGLLEAATMRMVEDFYKSDRKTWWGIYLGETISHIQVAATYRYGVPLADPAWEIVTRGPICVVFAPELRPSTPVAIDTATLREKTASGWARFNSRINLEDLRRSLTAELEDRAFDSARLALAREASRRTIGEFVEHWLVTRGQWQAGAFSAVKVYFPDEVDEPLRAQLREAR
jgi:hypothetical protein